MFCCYFESFYLVCSIKLQQQFNIGVTYGSHDHKNSFFLKKKLIKKNISGILKLQHY